MAVLPLTDGYEPVVGVRPLRIIATVDYNFRTGLTKTSGEVFLGGVIEQGRSVVFTDSRSIPVGLQYDSDYSSTFVDTSIPNWGAVKASLGGQALSSTITSPGIGNDGQVVTWNNTTQEYELSGGVGTGTFSSDIPVVLSGGKTLGKYGNGDTIPATGKTAEEVLTDIALEYINSSFTSFSVSGQSTTVEVGTTLSGNKTFTWNINQGSGSVPTVDIYDITDASYIVTGTPNDNTQIVSINNNKLDFEGVAQSWRAEATDVTPDPDVDFNSSTFSVTPRYYRFYDPVASVPTDSAGVRALTNEWQTGTDTFILNTGTTNTDFFVALPPGVTISSVVDLDSINAEITSEYVSQSSIGVIDAGNTTRSYNIYLMQIAVPYDTNHRHQITAG